MLNDASQNDADRAPLRRGEVVRRLRIHRNTFYRMLDRGDFPNAYRVGKHVRVPLCDIERIERSGQVGQN